MTGFYIIVKSRYLVDVSEILICHDQKKKKACLKKKDLGFANSVLKSVNTVIFGMRTSICSIFIVDGRYHVMYIVSRNIIIHDMINSSYYKEIIRFIVT